MTLSVADDGQKSEQEGKKYAEEDKLSPENKSCHSSSASSSMKQAGTAFLTHPPNVISGNKHEKDPDSQGVAATSSCDADSDSGNLTKQHDHISVFSNISVQKAMQTFNSANHGNDALASFEKPLNKKSGNVEDSDSRNVAIVLDLNEKLWLIGTAQGNMVSMRRLLDAESDLAEKKDFFLNGIHWAAKKGNTNMLKMVLEHNAKVNLRTGYTPLHLAAMGGHEQCISLLLDYGADVNLRDYSGKKPISYLREPPDVNENAFNEADEMSSDNDENESLKRDRAPQWQRHYFNGVKNAPLISEDVYERMEIKMITSKMDNEVVRRRQSESTASVVSPVERKQRSKSTVFVSRKNSYSENSKAKVSRKESRLFKMPSIRRSKTPSVSTIEHPVTIATPQALSHIATGIGWKPAGPQS